MPDAAAEILRQHRALLQNLHELIEALGQKDFQTNRQRLAEFLRNDFLPHAKAECEHLYPALSALINAVNRGGDLLVIDHQIITAFAEQILSKIGTAGSEQDDAAHVTTLAVQLEALVLARMEKEERVCLPLVESLLSDQEQERILRALHISPPGARQPSQLSGGPEVRSIIATRNHPERLVPGAGKAVESLQQYQASGGLEALKRAFTMHQQAVIDEISRSGLRGRGGGGFPTGAKWNTVLHSEGSGQRYVCCNGAEGEPGTFKDRFILGSNPYQVLEGLAIGAYAVGAKRAFVCLKSAFAPELQRIRQAIDEIQSAGILELDRLVIEVIEGPEEYLFGEEKALLEVIEGNLPLPRVLAPFIEGIFRHAPDTNPTLVNNVETLANVPHIIRNGAEWFRQVGAASSPGTMVFTVCGDVIHPGCYELPLGTPLRVLIEECARGIRHGHKLKAILSGASNGVLRAEDLDVAMDFESLRAAGSGLGSAGFIVYDDSTCMVEVAALFSRFLYVESCGQCPPCKFGTRQITEHLDRVQRGEGAEVDIDTCLEHCPNVAHGNRCALPVGERNLVESIIGRFGDEFRAHLQQPCRLERQLVLPKLAGFEDGRFMYDQRQSLKNPDWTYSSATS
jgi:NADH-quinone oxidoreductase subunit F